VLKAANNPATKSGFTPSRREFAAFGATAAMCSANAAPLAAATGVTKSVVQKVKITGNLFQPETGKHPGLVMFASAAASRSANAAVAQQLAAQGWAVMLVDAPEHADTAQLNRDAQAHAKWLVSQAGVAAPERASRAKGLASHGFVLRSFSAAHPALSLATRTERRAANASGTLFALPTATQSQDRLNSLHSAARALHRFSA
jgi:hypothetical protein